MRVGVIMGGMLFGRSEQLRQLPDVARAAEASGVDMLTLPDHVVLGSSIEAYPYGAFPAGPTLPYPEPLTMLAAAAGTTTSIELHTSTLIVPLRPAVLLAKACATVDALSGGRFVLGAGAGWHEDEFVASGVPFARRGERMDDTLRACRALWRDSPAAFSSSTVSFDGIYCEPRPVRAGGIPIWVGGSSIPRTARRVVDYADGWIPPPSLSLDEVGAGIAQIREKLRGAGQDPQALQVSFSLPILDGGLEESLEAAVPSLREAGVTVIQVTAGRFAAGPDEAPAVCEHLARAFAPYR
jgi:probable F420-dependent oxidoreductase